MESDRKYMREEITVVAGLVTNSNKEALFALRPDNGLRPALWEFPGGKVDPGESYKDALVRELEEELGIVATVGSLISCCTLDLESKADLLLYSVTSFIGKPKPLASDGLSFVDITYAVKHMPLAPSCYLWYRDVVERGFASKIS